MDDTRINTPSISMKSMNPSGVQSSSFIGSFITTFFGESVYLRLALNVVLLVCLDPCGTIFIAEQDHDFDVIDWDFVYVTNPVDIVLRIEYQTSHYYSSSFSVVESLDGIKVIVSLLRVSATYSRFDSCCLSQTFFAIGCGMLPVP